ncbi:MAG TPA: hypothetical protein VLT33_28920 [Labilithrix sp.]|nr:hypothetical protein [Labilithrix sp.]
MLDLSTFASCSDLTSEHAKQAASSSTDMRVFLKRVAEIARPDEGCPKLLMALARLVGQEWVEGELRIELSGDDASTTLIILCEYGVGIRERMFPLLRLPVPFDEFQRALELAPQLVLPLRTTDEDGSLVLTPLLTPEERIHAAPPPPDFELDHASLGEEERTTAPPPPDELQVLDEALPDESIYEAETVPPAAGAAGPHEATTAPPAPPPSANASGEHELEHEPRMESGPVPSENNPDGHGDGDRSSSIHTRPTVRRMVAVDAAAIAAVKRRDPRREDD